MSEEEKAALNTDRDLWREPPGDYYANRLFLTEGGGIGMDVGGHCIVKPIKEWFRLARAESAPQAQTGNQDAIAATLHELTHRDPSEAELRDPIFNAVWNAIKEWDICRDQSHLYAGATGTDVCIILDAIEAAKLTDEVAGPVGVAPQAQTAKLDEAIAELGKALFSSQRKFTAAHLETLAKILDEMKTASVAGPVLPPTTKTVDKCPTCGSEKRDAPIFDCLMQGIDDWHSSDAALAGESKL